MNKNNPQKIVIIGATSGIGKEMAEQYAAAGHKLGITGRRKELLEEFKAKYPAQTELECFDVTGTENSKHLQLLIDRLGGMDILVYNSGIGEPSKELDWQIDKLTTDTNVNGFIEICNYGFNYFAKQSHGRLVTISSVASHKGNSWAPAYSASKAFQSLYFEGLAMKAYRMKKKVFVTCIEPGFVATKMAKGNKLFWVVPLEKAARQIINAIEKGKRRAYISKRWWLIGKLLRLTPYWIYKRVG